MKRCGRACDGRRLPCRDLRLGPHELATDAFVGWLHQMGPRHSVNDPVSE